MNRTKGIILLALSFVLILSSCMPKADFSAVDPESEEMIMVEIPSGSTGKSVSDILLGKGLIKSKGSFLLYLKQNKLSDQLQAGKYELSKAMDIAKIAKKLTTGDVYTDTVSVLIPEGYEFKMIVDAIAEKMDIDKEKFIELCNTHEFKQDFMQYVPAYNPESGVKYRLEGFLFPATYEFQKGASELDIINIMLDRFAAEIKPEYYESLSSSPLNFYQTIILASIVEREGAAHEEFPKIAGVFMNRVNKQMLFQSCATVQYVIEERKPVLTYDDIAIENPYNTYKYAGLPPSPIASPGGIAINAAFNPEKHDYLFFVVNGKDNKHIFSKTNAEHEAAKKKALD